MDNREKHRFIIGRDLVNPKSLANDFMEKYINEVNQEILHPRDLIKE